MKLKATYIIPARRERVFALLTDATVLQRCIDGCEKMVKTGDGAYDVQLKIGAAGLKGTYTGKVQIKDQIKPESYRLVLEGKGAPGFLKGDAMICFKEKGEETQLECEADAQVGGLIAAIGSRLVEAFAKKMMDEFFKKFSELVKRNEV